MLSTLITSKSRVEILTRFVTHPGERFHYMQLDRLLKASRPSIQKELKRLEDAGILASQKEANTRFYWINQNHPLYPELKSIIFKTAGLADFLRESLAQIGPIDIALIYGSIAKNVEDVRSDIDLLVIGDIDLDALHEAVDAAEKSIDREINPATFTHEEWRARVKRKQAFATDILAGPKIILIGDEDELRRPA
jgi:predicted nucleotidyltransferase/biotin operon repressor